MGNYMWRELLTTTDYAADTYTGADNNINYYY
jgi:hypothetical protein